MAEKSLLEFSAPSIGNIRTGPKLLTNNLEFELKSQALSTWFKPLHSVERHKKMLMFIYRIF
jgi:hypothetical protein